MPIHIYAEAIKKVKNKETWKYIYREAAGEANMAAGKNFNCQCNRDCTYKDQVQPSYINYWSSKEKQNGVHD